jgi:hypothetical protein
MDLRTILMKKSRVRSVLIIIRGQKCEVRFVHISTKMINYKLGMNKSASEDRISN